jgi:hypothetical protein
VSTATLNVPRSAGAQTPTIEAQAAALIIGSPDFQKR